MNFVVKSLITAVLLSSLTVSPSYGLEPSDPNFSECEKTNVNANYNKFVQNFQKLALSRSTSKPYKQKVLVQDGKKMMSAIESFAEIQCGSFSVVQWESIKQDRINSQSKAGELLNRMMRKYPFTTISCFKNGIPQNITGINPVCPKGFKKVS